MDSLASITEDAFRRATDDGSWRRGQQYSDQGRVIDLVADRGELIARVEGQHAYRVRLWVEGGEPAGTCTCPMGRDGVFCKHCVAVGLAYLHAEASGEGSASMKPTGVATLDKIREHLQNQPVSELVELLMQQVREDEHLRNRLRLTIARQHQGGPDLDAYRRAIDDATAPHGDIDGYVDYDAAVGFVDHLDEAVNAIAELLDEGHAGAVIELAEHALERWEETIEHVDDSHGEMQPIQERLIELHHDACLQAKPDSVELAHRLFEWELDSDWSTFHGAAETYADVLGERGLAEYRRLAERAWAKLPDRGPEDQAADRLGFDAHRFRVRSMMEALARATGGVDELVKVKRKDLSSPLRFLEIAQLLLEAGREDDALAWAERGQQAFTGHPDRRLEAFLIDQYRRQGRDEDALALRWGQFERDPSLQAYQNLHEMATVLGQWDRWREKAQAQLRRGAGPNKRRRRGWSDDVRHAVLVRLLLWEGRVDEAWTQAHCGECPVKLWRELAEARAADHPADAAEVLGSQAELVVQQANKQAYAEATDLIRRVRELMDRTGEREQFEAWLEELRHRHRRKRNFMAMLEAL